MEVTIKSRSQFANPRIIDNDGRTNFCCLNYGFTLAAILAAFGRPLDENYVDRSFLS